MQPIKAKEQLDQWLRRRGITVAMETKNDRHFVCTAEGEECLLWLPEMDTTLFIFTLVDRLTMPKDNDLLTLSMALNLEPTRTGGASLGYNPESKQLMLRSVHDMTGLDDVALDRILEQMSKLAGALRLYLDAFRNQRSGTRHTAKGPLLTPGFHSPRLFT
ncbi:CesT family type III secretion system chaperone [Pseudomonas indica]|uniref:Tir chaperone protein (CesT) family protein n=1 Tax=Pseudomonas indica TaxID=137658 RepID=A0A1G9NBJ9_9PSED|nr:CesT family type III secretion system chaperone [Pseudomonas indica]SDL83840.1 Tir chaperone protein (CesT) family protein [Pseudomonas indica]